MKVKLHHIELCVEHPDKIIHTFCRQFGLNRAGFRETPSCRQFVLKSGKTCLVVTSKNKLDDNFASIIARRHGDSGKDEIVMDSDNSRLAPEPWTVFCCEGNAQQHVDSVFNVALQVPDLQCVLDRLKRLQCSILRDFTHISDENGTVKYAIVKSCCGNIVHTLIEKSDYTGWFLPQYEEHVLVPDPSQESQEMYWDTFFDHVTFACRPGGTDDIIRWYQDTFDMKRFRTNREDSEEEGLVIGDDIGLRLKVMEFWKCSEVGIGSTDGEPCEMLKIVIAESLPSFQNTQVEHFLTDHNGPGIQHIGFHTTNIVATVNALAARGVEFRQPPPAYYTPIGQLGAIQIVGEDLDKLRKYGILLDCEADPFEDENENIDLNSMENSNKYLMQIFTYPIFSRDTFFLEVIQRKGARGFGVGNVTALARSVNAYKKELEAKKLLQDNLRDEF